MDKSTSESKKKFDVWRVVKIVVGVIFIFGIYGFAKQLFVDVDDIGKGITDVFGDFVNIVDGLTNDCGPPQPTCSNNTQQTCTNKACQWLPAGTIACSSDDDCTGVGNTCDRTIQNVLYCDLNSPGSCYNKNGKGNGEGGFFSLQCGIFVGLLSYIGASILFALGGKAWTRFTRTKTNEALETESRLSNKPTDELLKNYKKQVRDKAEQLKKEGKWPDESKPEEIRLRTELITEAVSRNSAMEEISKTSENKKQDADKLTDSYERRVQEAIDKAIRDERMTEDEAREQKDAVDEDVPEIRPEGI